MRDRREASAATSRFPRRRGWTPSSAGRERARVTDILEATPRVLRYICVGLCVISCEWVIWNTGTRSFAAVICVVRAKLPDHCGRLAG
eukprot:scaffold235742_cov28-Tisochrysis_lutea.AAC.2